MIVTQKKFRNILPPERLSALEEKFNRRGVIVVLFGRHLIGLRAQIFLVAGVMRMSFLKFLLTDAFSSLFTIAIMVGAGYVGGNSLQIIQKDMKRIEHIAIFLAVVLFVFFLLLRFVKSRHK